MPRSSTAEKPTRTPRVLTGLRLPSDLLLRVDSYCRQHPLRPSRTRIVEHAVREFLAREQATSSEPKGS